MRLKDLRHLPKVENRNRFSAQSQFEPREEGRSQDPEQELFQQAMQDVQPLKDKGSGRQIVPRKQEDPASSQPPDSEEESRQYLHDLVEGKVEFEIELTSEFVQGTVKGLDPRIFRQLKSGHYSPQAHLDLHGLTTNIAWQQLVEFIKKSYLAGKRCLLLIPGRGKNSPQGRGVLREQVQQWLTRDPLKRVVLAFSTAQPQHGGAGALYILLRKYKKSHGKIFWERIQKLTDL